MKMASQPRLSILLLGLTAVVPVLLPAVVYACAVCISGSANDPTADAYNSSVLFLMATPYAVFGTIGGWLFYRHRRESSEKNERSHQDQPDFRIELDTQENEK